jgi:hypothetical protein
MTGRVCRICVGIDPNRSQGPHRHVPLGMFWRRASGHGAFYGQLGGGIMDPFIATLESEANMLPVECR